MFFPDWVEGSPIDRSVFLPGATTDGHYQIEGGCETCHTANFSDVSQMQEACVECHAAELERVDDSHPRTKFTDPRNADRVEVLDARWCTTCHQEHRPEITSTMGLSLPVDYCFRCHENVGEERPTHRDLAFETCASAGCHNFHDNKALYEDFLVEHRLEDDFKADPRVLTLASRAIEASDRNPDRVRSPLGREEHDAPANLDDFERHLEEWSVSAHASAGVNCTDCHVPEEASASGAWIDRPGTALCQTCHENENQDFESGRHGMRIAAGLSAMTPRQARLPMQPDAADHPVDCNACHSAHRYDTDFAAAEACLGCHADEHSLAYEGSPHAGTWALEMRGGEERTGVSCATCHLPRIPVAGASGAGRVAHNQNDFLRPNEKMIRPVCMQCHGLAFSIDALADPALIHTNFRGQPARKIESIHYASTLRWRLEGKAPPWADAKQENEE
jgi:predicted CXXCH cytochrome family protein